MRRDKTPQSAALEFTQRMARSRDPGGLVRSAAPNPDPVAVQPELGDRLKVMFGEMSAGPMPPRLLELADRLEEAFQRGELFGDCGRRRAS